MKFQKKKNLFSLPLFSTSTFVGEAIGNRSNPDYRHFEVGAQIMPLSRLSSSFSYPFPFFSSSISFIVPPPTPFLPLFFFFLTLIYLPYGCCLKFSPFFSILLSLTPIFFMKRKNKITNLDKQLNKIGHCHNGFPFDIGKPQK